jgi:hypothetical protein
MADGTSYGRIYIVGEDSVMMKKKLKVAYGGRMTLLYRTLLSRPDFADYVRDLTLPDYDPSSVSTQELHNIESRIATLVEQCPNLERLLGVHIQVTSSHSSPIHFALSSRPHLKEHLWLLNLSGPLQYAASESFLSLHQNWASLETLVLQGTTPSSGGGGLNHLLFVDLFSHLPHLQRLMISRFAEYEFNSTTLLSLPSGLTHLRLGTLPGVSEAGLSAYITSSQQLQSLALLNLQFQHLETISTIFSVLPKLRSFTFLQTTSPQPGSDLVLLASESLQFLHWDIRYPGAATDFLATCIHRGYLPALRTLRAPTDTTGALQAVCAPITNIVQPLDLQLAGQTRGLPRARVEAECRRTGQHLVVPSVVQEQEEHDWMGWRGSSRDWKSAERKKWEVGLGDRESRVRYWLMPDVEGSLDAVCRVGDVVGRFRGGEDGGVGGCEGTGVAKRVSRAGMWWHANRPRMRQEETRGLGILFR